MKRGLKLKTYLATNGEEWKDYDISLRGGGMVVVVLLFA